jgi:hypothetical protein
MAGFGDDVLHARGLPEARRGISFAYLGDAQNNVGKLVGAEI